MARTPMIFQTLAFFTLITPIVSSPLAEASRFDIPCVIIHHRSIANAKIEIPSLEEEMKARGLDKAHFKYQVVSTSVYYELDDWSEATCTVEVTVR